MPGTIYPSGIDSFAQLPVVSDGVSPIKAADVNRIRDTIVVVETELGINPSGTYGTTKDRLDALEALVTGDGYALQADQITVEDTGGFYTGTNVEAVLAEIAPQLGGGGGGDGYWTGTAGGDIYNNNSGNVGIGDTTPARKLVVADAPNARVFDVSSNAVLSGSQFITMGIGDPDTSNSEFLIRYLHSATEGDRTGHLFMDGDTAGTEGITVRKGGNVGIGTAAPALSLSVESGTADDGIRVTGTGSNTTPSYYIRAPNSGYGRHIWENAAGTASWVYYASFDASGNQIAWSVNDAVVARDRMTIYGGPLIGPGLGTVYNEAGEDFDFRVEGNTEANLFVADAGNDRVAVGTLTPSSRLHVYEDINSDSSGLRVQNINTGTAAIASIRAVSNGAHIVMNAYSTGNTTTAWGTSLADAVVFGGGSDATRVIFGTYGTQNVEIGTDMTSGTQPQLFLEHSSGDVGVGTSTPGYRVHGYDDVNNSGYVLMENPNAGTGAIAGLAALNNASVSANVLSYGSANISTAWNASVTLASGAIFAGSSNATKTILGSFGSSDVLIGGNFNNAVNDAAIKVDGTNHTVVINDGGNSTSDFRVESSSNTHQLFVDAGNNSVGINTDTPTGRMTVASDNAGSTINNKVFSNTTTHAPQFSAWHVGGTEASPAATPDGSVLGSFNFVGYSIAPNGGAEFQAIADGLWSGSNEGAYFRWNTIANGSTGTPVERMRLDSSGNLGINVSPSGRLHVVETSATNTALMERSVSADAVNFFNAMRLQATTDIDMADGFGVGIVYQIEDTVGGPNIIFETAARRDGADNSGALTFNPYLAGVRSEAMRITSAGNVGIGIANADPVQYSGALVASRVDEPTNIRAVSFSSTPAHAGHLDLQHNRGTLGAETSTLSGDRLGRISFIGWRGTVGDGAVFLDAEATENWSPNSGAKFTISVSETGSETPVERLGIGTETVFNETGGDFDFRIEGVSETNLFFADAGTARVGIGLGVPEGKLHVYNDINADTSVYIENPNTGAGALAVLHIGQDISTGNGTGLQYLNSGFSTSGLQTANQAKFVAYPNATGGWLWQSQGNGPYIFTIGNAVDVTTERFRISNSEVVVNENGESSVDFRVESATRASLLHVDGGLDRVGINRTAGNAGATLDVDNLAVAESIFIARDNGTAVFTIADGGTITATGNVDIENGADITGASITHKAHASFTGSESVQTTAAVQTTDATVTTLASLTLSDTTVYWLEAHVIGRETDGSNRAFYVRSVYAYREGGSATLGSIQTVVTDESDTNWDVTFDTSTNDVRVRVTGLAATTINWACTLRYQAVSGNS